ncbi:restriction endonuclease subunit S [Segatella copri]|uniref:restriction endonuclease subunit S n=1 Tax=Segatella copri TaxID=165179 RepID=UPI00294B047D|nr:restriction endonuclease subunit S [Segatella copri]
MEWKHYKMDELIEEISMGPFGSDVKKEFYVDNGVPILNGSNLQGFKLQEDSFGYLTKEKADSLKKCNAHRGDIIVTHRGTLGQIVYVPVNSKYDRYVISQSQFRFRCKADLVNVQYLVYYFHTREGQYKILANASQVGVPALARATSTFRLIDIKLPPLDDQRRIASILSSLDRKIELNNKINADLEEMAQAIFKNWFVDIEPFKDGKFVDSELGMIPEGWKVGKADDFYQINIGKTPPRKEHKWFSTNPADKIWVSIANMGNSGIFISDSSEYLTKEAVDRHNIIMVPRNTILLSFKLTVGRVAIADKELTTNEAIARFILSDDKYMEYLYLYLKNFDYNSLGSTSSIATAVNSKTIKGMQMLQPSDKIIDAFHIQVNPIFEKIRSLTKENSRLSLLRDTLLPRLMSGELEVPE